MKKQRKILGEQLNMYHISVVLKNKIEHGYIKGVNDNFVFVCFGARTMDRGEACRPEDLQFD